MTKLATTALLAMGACSAHSAEQPLWELGMGLSVLSLPDYRGADERTHWLLPLPYIQYRGERLRWDREGGRLGLARTRNTRLDLSLAAGPPANSDDNRARRGMEDLDPTVEIGPRLRWRLWQSGDRRQTLQVALPVRAVAATDLRDFRSLGWVLAPNLKWEYEARWKTGVALGPLFASEKYHDYFYQVDAGDARPGRPVYDADSGYSGTRLTLTLSRRFGEWWLGGFARYDYLQGAVFDDSPLVRQDHAWMAGIGVARVLARSARTVTHVDDW